MPDLTAQPKEHTPAACKMWAEKQSEDAIDMWGIQEEGTTSQAVAIDRLAGDCLGRKTQDIVGFGSSIGFDTAYCKSHPTTKICKGKR